MTEKTTKKVKASGAELKLMSFGAVTVIWLGLALYLGWNAHEGGAEECTGTYSCLTANEWGDFLAGVFAPVAFFWLLAAVWVQSDELKVTREVMQVQADEARKQAEFIGTQTAILKHAQADNQFREMLSMFQFWVRREFVRNSRVFDAFTQTTVLKDVGYLTESTPPDPIEFYIEVCARLTEAVLDKRNTGGTHEWERFIDTTIPKRGQIVTHLRTVSNFEKDVSQSMLRVLNSTYPDQLADELEKALA